MKHIVSVKDLAVMYLCLEWLSVSLVGDGDDHLHDS
jgi:hypothetical protein